MSEFEIVLVFTMFKNKYHNKRLCELFPNIEDNYKQTLVGDLYFKNNCIRKDKSDIRDAVFFCHVQLGLFEYCDDSIFGEYIRFDMVKIIGDVKDLV